MKVATHEQVTNIEITREVKMFSFGKFYFFQTALHLSALHYEFDEYDSNVPTGCIYTLLACYNKNSSCVDVTYFICAALSEAFYPVQIHSFDAMTPKDCKLHREYDLLT